MDEEKTQLTQYVVLKAIKAGGEDGPGLALYVVGGMLDGKPETWTAPNRERAIKNAAVEKGTYVAVPARSFAPVAIEAEERPALKARPGSF